MSYLEIFLFLMCMCVCAMQVRGAFCETLDLHLVESGSGKCHSK